METQLTREEAPPYQRALRQPTVNFVIGPPPQQRNPVQFFADHGIRVGSRLDFALTSGKLISEDATGCISMTSETLTDSLFYWELPLVSDYSRVPLWAAMETFLFHIRGKGAPLAYQQQFVTIMPLADRYSVLTWCYFLEHGWFADLASPASSWGPGVRMVCARSHAVSN